MMYALELEAHEWRNDMVAAERSGERALELLPVGTGPWHDAVGVMASVWMSLGRRDRVLALASGLEDAGLDTGCERCVQAWVRVAVRLLFLAEYAVADRLLEPLAAVSRDPFASHNVRGAVLEALAHRRQLDGDLDEALRLATAAVEDYRAAGNTRDANYERIAVALVHAELGAFAAAETTLRELVHTPDVLAIPTSLAVAQLNLGLILHYRGAHREAEAVERQALVALDAAGDQRLTATARGYLCRILLAAGNVDDAIAEGLRAEAAASAP